jgi:DNA-directed RNA polymerase subunit RPC12/RpoP
VRGGHAGSHRYHLICLKCLKQIKTPEDYELDALNEDNPAHECDKCGKRISWLKFRIIHDHRTFIGEDIVQIKSDYHRLCDDCVKTIEYIVIPRYIQCDLCHKPHEREFYADDQGQGLCGYVKRNYKYPGRIGWMPGGDRQILDGYVIDCEYGSRYDACGNHNEFIQFMGNQLPDTLHEGMNICDECITNLIQTGICIDPTRDNPSIKDDFVVIPPECIQMRPSLP